MISSMTAFSRIEEGGDWGTALWEIRSVNHRYLELFVRLPEDLRPLEPAVRERIAARLSRGKVDCVLRFDAAAAEEALQINTAMAQRLLAAARALPLDNPDRIDPLDFLRWPGVLERRAPDLEALGPTLLRLLDGALDSLVETRRREGARIGALVAERCRAVRDRVAEVRALLPGLLSSLRERYRQRARELEVELDRERLEQEIMLLVQKMDVTEELDRLETHAIEVERVLGQDEPVGRRLDCLMQELNREANTLGSKAGSIDLTTASLDLKVLIEQMREQIQNIE